MWFSKIRSLDLRAKILLILIAVILPTFIVVTLIQNQLTKPILEEEMKQLGITTGKTLAAEIVSQRFLSLPNPTPALEKYLQEFLYAKPHVVRMEVLAKNPVTGNLSVLASNIEEEPEMVDPLLPSLVDSIKSEYKIDEQGVGMWEIFLPIAQFGREIRGSKKILGNVHVVVSTRVVHHIVNALWKVTVTAAATSVVILILVLGYFLRKTIENDRLLRQAESENIELTEQLHEIERQLMQTEKLAVMGQLTARFAHEIGTPLTAIGGHLQLLKEEEMNFTAESVERFEVINGQLQKIEQIVKGFLQSTLKPPSQRQLVDLNQLVDRCLGIVQPRVQAIKVKVQLKLDRKLGPLRAVPLELEQILLNIVSNSLDSLKSKGEKLNKNVPRILEIQTSQKKLNDTHWALLSIYDTGEGIRKVDLDKVGKPFFSTKGPKAGTGLGLTICQELVRKHDGLMEIDSKEGAYARVVLKFPYQVV